MKSGLTAAGLFAVAAGLFTSCAPTGKPRMEETVAENVKDFPTLYRSNCAGCHGDEGKNGPGRILNDSLYLSFIPKAELRKVLVYGRPGTSMPAWAKSQGGPLTDEQIDALTEGIYSHWARPFNTRGAPIPAYSAPEEGGDAANGRRLFTRSCFICHGPGARVGLVSNDTYLELVSNQMLRTAIVVGRPDLGMPNYQTLKLGKPLTEADVTDITAYLVSLRKSPAPGNRRYTNDKGTGATGEQTTGNAGSGHGPGSPSGERNEGHKHVNTSMQGGPIETKGNANEKRNQ